MNKSLIISAAVGLGVFMIPLAEAASKTVYDNATTAKDKNLFESVEFGDQIILDTGFFYPSAKLDSFIFQYVGVNFSGDETARIRFYKNDGLLGKPGTLVFDSEAFEIPEALTGATVDLGDLGVVVVPQVFTWTIAFTGVEASKGESAGLSLYGPPATGNGYSDYWARNGNDWALKTVPGVDGSFAALINGTSVIPEPSTLALSIAGLALLGMRSRRKL